MHKQKKGCQGLGSEQPNDAVPFDSMLCPDGQLQREHPNKNASLNEIHTIWSIHNGSGKDGRNCSTGFLERRKEDNCKHKRHFYLNLAGLVHQLKPRGHEQAIFNFQKEGYIEVAEAIESWGGS